MNATLKYLFTVLFMFIIGCESKPVIDQEGIKNEIVAVMDAQEAAWNDGNLEEYMNGYWRSDSLRFASGGNVSYGWEQALDNYRRGYPDRSIMGHLTFYDVEVTLVSDNAAVVFGKWALERESDNPWGLYTLLFRNTKDGWRVVADHTSSAGN